MKEEKFLNSIRQKYESTEPPVHLKLYGWQHILTKIDKQERPTLRIFYRFAFATLTILILLAVSLRVYRTALAAVPGNPLYPMKLFSESIINKVNGNNQASIDNRAQEIVIIAKEQGAASAALKTAVSEYTQSIESATVKAPDFQKKLEEQHNQFDTIIKNSPQIEKDIKDAVDISQTHDNGHDGGDEHQGNQKEGD